MKKTNIRNWGKKLTQSASQQIKGGISFDNETIIKGVYDEEGIIACGEPKAISFDNE